MARQLEDKVTGELFEVRRGRGRPRKDGVLTGAQRQARYQAKKNVEQLRHRGMVADAERRFQGYELETLEWMIHSKDDEDARLAWVEVGRRKGWIL
ncbi:hypothetical protein [Zoogloea sp.]|jgi:hypothetical protein|uniref:hypothetical protein n=1 Tax=Zoogloea sp. TaxID=49181 RepID=UPI0035B37502